MDGPSIEGLHSATQAVELGRAGETRIINPAQAAIPRSEGIHLEVRNSGGEKPWAEEDPGTLLRDSYFAIAAAKAVAEGRFTPEQWVNIHLDGQPQFNQGVNVFGRNPESASGWGKPVQFKPGEAQLSSAEAQDLKRLFAHYLPLWEKTMPQINLFAEGTNAFPPDLEVFQQEFQEYSLRSETLLWMNDKFALVVVNVPHLNGMHLVVHGRDSYWKDRGGLKRPWQNQPQGVSGQMSAGAPGSAEQSSGQTNPPQITGFLEAEAILIGAQRVLLGEGKLPFYNPEVHFSSNWAASLQPIEKGGKLDTSYFSADNLEQARKDEKRSHRVGGDREWDLGMHGHLYATRDSGKYVELPSRPQAEVPDQWEGIRPPSEAEVGQVRELIQQGLTPWLIDNATGSLSAAQPYQQAI